MGNQRDRQFTLPKNIRQIGTFGDTYKIYVEDFVYTYVHRTLHMEKKEDEVVAAVLLGKTYRRANQEYVFISGAQQVRFFTSEQPENIATEWAMDGTVSEEESIDISSDEIEEFPDDKTGEYEIPVSAASFMERQQEFWEKVYQGIKEYFSELELLGWYFNLDGGNLEISTALQQFFDTTEEHGSRFLYFEDKLDRLDAFFVQEQHSLQRVDGYAVYYEKNPAMQEFLVAQHRHTEPPRKNREEGAENREDVAQNYRAILKKLNEKPTRKKRQPAIYAAGIAVLAVVAATGITQVGNYKNLKTLEQTLQTVSGNVHAKRQAETATDSSEDTKTSEENGQAAQNSVEDGSEKTDETKQENGSTQQTDAQQNVSPDKTDSGAEASSDQTQDLQNGQTDNQPEDKATAANVQEAKHYTVKKGDSLMSISKEIYHNTSMIDEICSLNQIENMDMIYEGQDLILP